jgi:hypothetical protein
VHTLVPSIARKTKPERARKPPRKPPHKTRAERERYQRKALLRHAMEGEGTRKKPAVTLPRLKFMEGEI